MGKNTYEVRLADRRSRVVPPTLIERSQGDDAGSRARGLLGKALPNYEDIEVPTRSGGLPVDTNSISRGIPDAPCTTAQRLDADEFGTPARAVEGFQYEDESARLGYKLLWFSTEGEAEAYIQAYTETCDTYETPRGIRRTLTLDTEPEPLVDQTIDDHFVLTSIWRATINGRGWGDDILHAGRIDSFVLEMTMAFNGPIGVRKPEAAERFSGFVEHVRTAYES